VTISWDGYAALVPSSTLDSLNAGQNLINYEDEPTGRSDLSRFGHPDRDEQDGPVTDLCHILAASLEPGQPPGSSDAGSAGGSRRRRSVQRKISHQRGRG